MSSARRWLHWCPNGCGKKVVYHSFTINPDKSRNPMYKCRGCQKEFRKNKIQITDENIPGNPNQFKVDEVNINEIPYIGVITNTKGERRKIYKTLGVIEDDMDKEIYDDRE